MSASPERQRREGPAAGTSRKARVPSTARTTIVVSRPQAAGRAMQTQKKEGPSVTSREAFLYLIAKSKPWRRRIAWIALRTLPD
jgi:hypothetical protein